ncbi:helix-turn-helix domain-containing protein [Mycobacteroides abscessus]|uniref:helix-turn-helix domain-containing protein n=1 Tax=Mycobacteroides abscessus TaxID=36809 RepID=UPI0009A67EC4|nr:helix-turn-helix domain-containing protein [Mycobacteroides abscessus]RIT47243.1 DNA-binding protein [Mycobacteroides abscessus]
MLVTRPEAARILSLSVQEIDRLRRAGRLLAKMHGSKVLFPMAELERYAEALPWEVDLRA